MERVGFATLQYPRRRSTDRSAARDARGNVISTTASAILHCYDQKGRRVKQNSSHQSIHVRICLIMRPTDPYGEGVIQRSKSGIPAGWARLAGSVTTAAQGG